MDIRLNPLLVPYATVEEAKRIADSLDIDYQLVRYKGQSQVWIIQLNNEGK